MPFARAQDGCRIWYEDQGDGDPVVLLHEFGGDHHSWLQQVSWLTEEGFRSIAYAARGFRPTGLPTDIRAYGQEQATDDLLALLDRLELAAVHLVGTSMGSFTSLDFTLCHGGRVRSLTLVGNSSGPREGEERDSYRANWLQPEIDRRQAEGGPGAVAILAEDPAYLSFQRRHPATWQAYAARLAGQSVEGALNILQSLHWDRRSLWGDEARLRAVACPVLLVHGAEDYHLVGETNRFLSEVIPLARLEVFEATGHLVNLERSEAFNALLGAHLAAV